MPCGAGAGSRQRAHKPSVFPFILPTRAGTSIPQTGRETYEAFWAGCLCPHPRGTC